MWDMKFHPDNSSQYDYILHGPESLVQLVDTSKYLGVTLSSDLS